MTTIRNIQTGQWIHPPRQQQQQHAPQFLLLEAISELGGRREYLIAIASIRTIERCADGYHITIEGRQETVLITPDEYGQLIATLESAGLVTMPVPGSERE